MADMTSQKLSRRDLPAQTAPASVTITQAEHQVPRGGCAYVYGKGVSPSETHLSDNKTARGYLRRIFLSYCRKPESFQALLGYAAAYDNLPDIDFKCYSTSDGSAIRSDWHAAGRDLKMALVVCNGRQRNRRSKNPG